jgi:prepilin-type processing-associated H-X9-DG protein
MNEHKDTDIQPADNVSLLSPDQLAAITLLATGAKVKTVAEVVGHHPNTVTRWRRTCEAFAAELEHQKKELYEAGLQKALAVLDEHLDAGNRLEQFRAANARLQYDAQPKRSNVSVDVKHSIIANYLFCDGHITARRPGRLTTANLSTGREMYQWYVDKDKFMQRWQNGTYRNAPWE